MALDDLITMNKKQVLELTEERIQAIIPYAREYISFWREYPDLFVDFLLKMGNPQNFEFYFFQRVFLRIAMRHQYVYAVFPRASIGANKFSLIEENFGQTSLIVGILNS